MADDNVSNATAAQQAVIAVNKLNETMSAFNTGIIPVTRMPALSGDVTTPSGSVTTTISAGAVEQAMLASGVAGNGPMFYANRGTVQSINNATATKLQVSTEIYDTASCYDNATNYRFTPNVAGHYLIIGKMSLASYTNGNNVAMLYVDGVSVLNGNQGYLFGSSVSMIQYFNGSTTYAELYGYQSTGGAYDIATSYFWGCLLRAA